jgi:hypothetical protein
VVGPVLFDTPGGTGAAIGWREIAFPTPVAISAAKNYVVSWYPQPGHSWSYQTYNPASLAPHLGNTQGFYSSGFAFPGSSAGNSYFCDVNFQPLVAQWPNPGSLPDLAVGGSPIPTVDAAALNGLPVVRFKPNEGFFSMTGTGITTSWTCAFVARHTGTAPAGRVVGAIHPAYANFLLGYEQYSPTGQDVIYDAGYGVPDVRVTHTNAWKLYSADGSGAASRLFSNGTLLSSVSTAAGWAGSFILNGYDLVGGNSGNMQLAEVVLYDSKLSDADRQKVESYLRWKWGL